MKKTHFILLAGLIALLFNASTAQASDKKGAKNKDQDDELPFTDTGRYIFYPITAFPLTEGPRQLSSGFSVKISKDTFDCYLPYFGEPNLTNYGMNETDLDFKISGFKITQKKVENKKEGEHLIIIKPKNQRDVREIYISSFDNGTAYVRFTFRNRQNISYRGEIARLTAQTVPGKK